MASGRGFLPCRAWGSAESHRCVLPLSAGPGDAAADSATGIKWLTEGPRLESVLCTHRNPCVSRSESSKGFGRSARGDVWMRMGGRGRAAVRPAFSFALRHSSGLQERGYFVFGLKKQSYLCPFMQEKGLWKVPGVPKVENHRPLPLPSQHHCCGGKTFHGLPPYPSHLAQFSREHPHRQVPTCRESAASSPGKGLLWVTSPSSSASAQLSLSPAEKQDRELGCLWSDPSNHPRRDG